MPISLIDRFGNITTGVGPKPNPMEPRLSSLGPEDILFYSMFHERITCKNCRSVNGSSRLWITYKEGRGTTSAPLGGSETIYARIPVKESFKDMRTPACPLCLDTIKREQWAPRTGAAANPAHSNILPGAASAKKTSAAPPRTPAVSLDELLKRMK